MSRYIRNLILQGENQQLDFKYEIADAPKIARTFAAFANTSGGRLLIGVKDNGVIAGIKTDEEIYMAESSAHLFCSPPVDYEIVPHEIDSKNILEVIIQESNRKPHKAPWKDGKYKAFIRVDDENFIANDVIIEVWRLKHRGKSIYVKYDNYEKELFELLNNRGEISFRDYVKACKIKPYLAKKILANFIYMNLIDIKINEYEAFYILRE